MLGYFFHAFHKYFGLHLYFNGLKIQNGDLLRATIFNASLAKKDQLKSFQQIIEEEFANVGMETKSYLLNQIEIKTCIGCFKCWTETPGICSGVKGDKAEDIKKDVVNSDLLVFLTPLTFGGYSSELKKVIERMLGTLQPGVTIKTGESHHLKRYDRYPSILAIATTDKVDPAETDIFKNLMYRHSLNFYPPSYIAEVLDINEDNDIVREKIKQYYKELEVGK